MTAWYREQGKTLAQAMDALYAEHGCYHNDLASFTFEGVTFRYRKTDSPAIDNLSFSVGPGDKVALVGRSGSGKTTVTALLMRFFDPQAGFVRLGGEDVR